MKPLSCEGIHANSSSWSLIAFSSLILGRLSGPTCLSLVARPLQVVQVHSQATDKTVPDALTNSHLASVFSFWTLGMISSSIPKMRNRSAEDTTIWAGNLPVASPYLRQSESEEKPPPSYDPAAGWVAWIPRTNIKLRRGCDLFAMLGPIEAAQWKHVQFANGLKRYSDKTMTTDEYDESKCEGASSLNADTVSFSEYRVGVGGKEVGDSPVKPAKLLVA